MTADFSSALALAERLRRLASHRTKPFIIALDGRSGSGKTTLAAALADALDASVVPGDDFFAGAITVSDDAPETLAARCIDWSKQRGVLLTLRSGRVAHYQPFDWDTFDGSVSDEARTIEPAPIIVVEGVYSARPELRDSVDYTILMTIDDAERQARLIKREGALGPWEQQWLRAEDWYFRHAATDDTFDLVIG